MPYWRAGRRSTHRTMLVVMGLADLLAAAIASVATHTVKRSVALRTHMQNEVRLLNSQLEEKVAQRTRDLSRTEDHCAVLLPNSGRFAGGFELEPRCSQRLRCLGRHCKAYRHWP